MCPAAHVNNVSSYLALVERVDFSDSTVVYKFFLMTRVRLSGAENITSHDQIGK